MIDASTPEARDLLTAALHVRRWVDQVAAGGPYASVDDLVAAGDGADAHLTDAELDEAVADHPRIGQRAGGDVDALVKQRLARIPLGFAGDGRDTASAVLFLASDEARFVTGTELVVDGGMSVRCG